MNNSDGMDTSSSHLRELITRDLRVAPGDHHYTPVAWESTNFLN